MQKEKAKISFKLDALQSHWGAIACRRLITREGRAREERYSGASGEFRGCRLGVHGSLFCFSTGAVAPGAFPGATGLGAKLSPGWWKMQQQRGLWWGPVEEFGPKLAHLVPQRLWWKGSAS